MEGARGRELPCLCPPFVAGELRGQPRNFEFAQRLSDASPRCGRVSGTRGALLTQAGSRFELFRGHGASTVERGVERERESKSERDQGRTFFKCVALAFSDVYLLRIFPQAFQCALSLLTNYRDVRRRTCPPFYSTRQQVPQNRRLGGERREALRRRGADVAHRCGGHRRREVRKSAERDAEKELERNFVAP